MYDLFLGARQPSPLIDKRGDGSSHTTATLRQHRIGKPANLNYLLSQLQTACVVIQCLQTCIISKDRKIKENVMYTNE